jgi:hypothetical protein
MSPSYWGFPRGLELAQERDDDDVRSETCNVTLMTFLQLLKPVVVILNRTPNGTEKGHISNKLLRRKPTNLPMIIDAVY